MKVLFELLTLYEDGELILSNSTIKDGVYQKYFELNDLMVYVESRLNYLFNNEGIPTKMKEYLYIDNDNLLTNEKTDKLIGYFERNDKSDFFHVNIYDVDEEIDFDEGYYVFNRYFKSNEELKTYLEENLNVILIKKNLGVNGFVAKLKFKE